MPGLIFLKFADINYQRYEQWIHAEFENIKGTRREKPIHEIAVARCGYYLPDHARYSSLLISQPDFGEQPAQG